MMKARISFKFSSIIGYMLNIGHCRVMDAKSAPNYIL